MTRPHLPTARPAARPAALQGLRRKLWRAGAALVVALAPTACIRAPDVVMVDRRTALEAEAAGRFEAEEGRLDQRAIDARPLPLTRAQLEAAGLRPRAEHDAIAAMTRGERGDAEHIDDLLKRRCVGEGLDGELVSTGRTCVGARDPAEIGGLVERTNLARRQVFAWLARQSPRSAPEQVRAAWRRHHLTRVVCGGQVQLEGGAWGEKKCD